MSSSPSHAQLLKALSLPTSTKWIVIYYVPYSNDTSYRVIPISQFLSSLSVPSSSNPPPSTEQHVIDITKIKGGKLAINPVAFYLVEGLYNPPEAGIGPRGEIWLVPDLMSVRGWNPLGLRKRGEELVNEGAYASVFGWFEDKGISNNGERRANVNCARGVLDRIVRTAKEELGIQFLAGFETEFILTLSSSETSPTGAPLPVNPYGWNESKAARSGTLELAVMEEICECLLKMGVEVLYWHAEAAPGQFEIVTAPLRPVQAVDCVVMTREVMYDVAQRYGLRATLAPRVFDSAPGSAAHVHISLSPTPSSPLPSSLTLPTPSNPYSLSSLEASFLQGILDHLPASCAFTLGAPQSYERVKDGIWSGGTWVCWGRDNKECPVRLCGSPPRPSNPSSFQPSSGTSGSSSTATTTATTTYEDGGDGGTINVTGAAGAGGGGWNLEVKCSDGTGNPYLALASLLASGILGIKSLLSSQSSSTSSQSLSINPSSPSSSSSTAAPSPPSSQLMEESLGQASSLPETTRQKMGIVQKLPTSFSEALKALEEDRELGGMLGEELVRSYAAVTRFRAERLEKLSLNELVDRF